MTYEEKKFNIPELASISAKTIEEHMKLYAGYVKHANLIIDKVRELSSTPDEMAKNAYTIGELQRRFGFEFDGMRNHEYYFEQLEGGKKNWNPDSLLCQEISKTWGGMQEWQDQFKALAMTRGLGWAILYHDENAGRLLHAWIDEQHLGHLTGLKVILALDMWEHSYMLDYAPSEKKKYVEAFFANLNAETAERRFEKR